jgi:hypothetical protein
MELTRVKVKAETMQDNVVISDTAAHTILSITTQSMHRRLCCLLQESYIIVPALGMQHQEDCDGEEFLKRRVVGDRLSSLPS